MTGRMTAVALLMAAATFPAQAGQDALQKLYELAETRNEATRPPERDTKAGAGARFDKYEPRTTVMAGQVRSVMHVHRTPDGRLVAECRTEYPGRDLEHDHGTRPPREQR